MTIYTLQACAQPRIGNSFHFTVTTFAFIKILTNKYVTMESNTHFITVQNFKPLCISILEICVHKDMAFRQKQQFEKNTQKRKKQQNQANTNPSHTLFLTIWTLQHSSTICLPFSCLLALCLVFLCYFLCFACTFCHDFCLRVCLHATSSVLGGLKLE